MTRPFASACPGKVGTGFPKRACANSRGCAEPEETKSPSAGAEGLGYSAHASRDWTRVNPSGQTSCGRAGAFACNERSALGSWSAHDNLCLRLYVSHDVIRSTRHRALELDAVALGIVEIDRRALALGAIARHLLATVHAMRSEMPCDCG